MLRTTGGGGTIDTDGDSLMSDCRKVALSSTRDPDEASLAERGADYIHKSDGVLQTTGGGAIEMEGGSLMSYRRNVALSGMDDPGDARDPGEASFAERGADYLYEPTGEFQTTGGSTMEADGGSTSMNPPVSPRRVAASSDLGGLLERHKQLAVHVLVDLGSRAYDGHNVYGGLFQLAKSVQLRTPSRSDLEQIRAVLEQCISPGLVTESFDLAGEWSADTFMDWWFERLQVWGDESSEQIYSINRALVLLLPACLL